jgi:hypothetical protein
VRTTSSSTLFRTEAAVASLLAGGLLIAGHLLNYGAGEYGTVFGTGLVLAAHVALVFSIVGVHAAQSSRAGLLGRVGTVLAMAGSVFVAAIVFVELAGTLADPITVVGAVLTGLDCLRLGIALVRPSVDLVDPEPIPSPAR